jgi:UDP-N-acetylmuramate: L-alanyl-gamma-D-glutamyl-meso-diaminopimelate ligase
VENGTTLLETGRGYAYRSFCALINNLAGAKWICQTWVLMKTISMKIASFKGASKRLEKIAESRTKVAYKDFAHSPSKVAATTQAVKEQYPDRRLVVV